MERRTRTLTNDRTLPRQQSKSLTRISRKQEVIKPPSYEQSIGKEDYSTDDTLEGSNSVLTDEIVSAFSPPMRRSRSLPRVARNRQPLESDVESNCGATRLHTQSAGKPGDRIGERSGYYL